MRELKIVDQRRAELSRLRALGERTSEEWATAREVVHEEQARLNLRLAELPVPDANEVDLSALPTAWPNMTIDERRQALLFACTKVTLWPAATHGKALDRRVMAEFLVNPRPPHPRSPPREAPARDRPDDDRRQALAGPGPGLGACGRCRPVS